MDYWMGKGLWGNLHRRVGPWSLLLSVLPWAPHWFLCLSYPIPAGGGTTLKCDIWVAEPSTNNSNSAFSMGVSAISLVAAYVSVTQSWVISPSSSNTNSVVADIIWRFSTAWYGTVRHGSVRYGTAQFVSVAFPPQFSTAIEWAGLFTRRYNCAASTAVTSS